MFIHRVVAGHTTGSINARADDERVDNLPVKNISVTPSVLVDLPASLTNGQLDRFSYPYPLHAASTFEVEAMVEAKVSVTAMAVSSPARRPLLST